MQITCSCRPLQARSIWSRAARCRSSRSTPSTAPAVSDVSRGSLPTPTFLTDDRAEVLNAFDRGALGTAATLVGLAQKLLDLTVEYVKQRQQFGTPIGSFQAVKHHLADTTKALAFARPAVYRASWSLAVAQRTDERDVSIAKALASEAALQAGRAALQCHGAIGYTVEHDLHLLLKRTWALARAWGDAAWHRDQIGHALGI